jgi:hypothetical protein
MTQAYLDAGARKCEPQCYLEHDAVPLDWGHTLAALYRVRCNLFHGEKARSSENDRVVVARARGDSAGVSRGERASTPLSIGRLFHNDAARRHDEDDRGHGGPLSRRSATDCSKRRPRRVDARIERVALVGSRVQRRLH